MLVVWILFCVANTLAVEDDQNGCTSQSDPIENILPCNYKNFKVPSIKDKAVQIKIGLQIYDIYDLNDETMDFYIHLIVNENWTDQRLRINNSLGSRPVLLPKEVANKIWQPDIFFENSKYGSLFDVAIPNMSYKLLPLTGEIYKSARYLLKISCSMDLHNYPMDTQTCHIKIALFSTPDDQAELNWVESSDTPAIDLRTDIALPQFSITATRWRKITTQWETGNYTTLLGSFIFTRYIMASLVNIYIPSILVVFLSWLSFWLDVDTVPARVTLGVTSLLTIATQVVQSRSSLPPIAYISALDVWLFVSVNMISLTLVEYGLAYYYTYYGWKKGPFWTKITDKLNSKNKVQGFATRNVKTILKPPSTASKPTSDEETVEGSKPQPNSKTKSVSGLDRISRFLFPFVFFIFNILYWFYYLCN